MMDLMDKSHSTIDGANVPQHQDGSNAKKQLSEKSKKNVTFGTVSCRWYKRTVGFHPDVTSGPPLDFDWNFQTSQDLSLEAFESLRGKRRLTLSELRIPKYRRLIILTQECELSRSLIASHVRQVTKVKAQRNQTLRNLRFAHIEERWQNLKYAICHGSQVIRRRKSHERQSSSPERSVPSNDYQKPLTTYNDTNAIPSEVKTNSKTTRKRWNHFYLVLCCTRSNTALNQTNHHKQYDIRCKRNKFESEDTLSDSSNNQSLCRKQKRGTSLLIYNEGNKDGELKQARDSKQFDLSRVRDSIEMLELQTRYYSKVSPFNHKQGRICEEGDDFNKSRHAQYKT